MANETQSTQPVPQTDDAPEAAEPKTETAANNNEQVTDSKATIRIEGQTFELDAGLAQDDKIHDGVTILGGEPFDQPGPVAELISRLKRRDFHIAIYSGYVLEDLIQRKTPSIDYILTHIDLLIDGPFVANLRDGAGEYRGSRNQKLVGL